VTLFPSETRFTPVQATTKWDLGQHAALYSSAGAVEPAAGHR